MSRSIFKLSSLRLSGYKSIAAQNDSQTIDFQNITVIIGANGAGKSNLVSFFKMLNMMTTGALQEYIARSGGANSILHYGSKQTVRIEANLKFVQDRHVDTYSFALSHASGDTLIFTDEELSWHDQAKFPSPQKVTLGSGHKESLLNSEMSSTKGATARVVYQILRSCRVFQFHDTSLTANKRYKVYIENNKFLYSDAGNLAPFLLALKSNEEYNKYYKRIVERIKLVMPQFGDFDLNPGEFSGDSILLNWRERDEHQYIFGPHQISDGTLRFMALATLLMQPPELLPAIIIIDEPELGLHPLAISILAGMVRSASQYSQVILATQSPRLVDEFDADDIVVIERDKESKKSIFKKLDSEKLQNWLNEYSISELWEKNVLGGQP
jgi:predicted ATPase